jgi:hypothetical protein
MLNKVLQYKSWEAADLAKFTWEWHAIIMVVGENCLTCEEQRPFFEKIDSVFTNQGGQRIIVYINTQNPKDWTHFNQTFETVPTYMQKRGDLYQVIPMQQVFWMPDRNSNDPDNFWKRLTRLLRQLQSKSVRAETMSGKFKKLHWEKTVIEINGSRKINLTPGSHGRVRVRVKPQQDFVEFSLVKAVDIAKQETLIDQIDLAQEQAQRRVVRQQTKNIIAISVLYTKADNMKFVEFDDMWFSGSDGEPQFLYNEKHDNMALLFEWWVPFVK